MSRSKPTIENVAARAGVSRSTVSRVMNDEPGVSGPARERVRAAMTELGYVPDQAARALASGRQRSVDVVAVTYGPVLGWLGSHPYFSRVLAGVVQTLDGTDVQVRIHAVAQPDDYAAVEAIAARASVGAVLTNLRPAMASRFRRTCRRAVSLLPTAPDVPALEADNEGGAYAAVEHLYRLGRRRIAGLHGPDEISDAAGRRAGYLRAAADFGLPVLMADGDFRREDGYAAALRVLERHPDVDGMFVACDLMAAGAVQALTAAGRDVPGDISVVGFDDSVAAECCNPPLTTMRLPVEEMAATATRLLLDGNVRSGFRQSFPVELVVRESSAGAGRERPAPKSPPRRPDPSTLP